MKTTTFVLALTAFIITSCSNTENNQNINTEPAYVQFFEALSEECENAYSGQLMIQPETVNMFTGTEEMVMHFMECSKNELKIPFHIEDEADESWDRSRTWILTLHEDGLELRHDHRNPDGTDEEVTMYGGYSVDEGTKNVQRFQSEPRTEEAGGEFRGWRIEYMPGERYTYGTIWEEEWNIMVEFDLSEPVEVPPVPWGHE